MICFQQLAALTSSTSAAEASKPCRTVHNMMNKQHIFHSYIPAGFFALSDTPLFVTPDCVTVILCDIGLYSVSIANRACAK